MKICGTTNLPDAELAVELGADALGFIFAPSKRRVSVEEAAAITADLPDHVELLGVFTAPDAAEIARVVQEVGLTGVQMHFAYDPVVIDALRQLLGREVKLWQVVGFPVEEGRDEAERTFVAMLDAALRDERISVILLDALHQGASGGRGEAFAWERARELVGVALERARRERLGTKARPPEIALAGGLTAENVQRAVGALEPWGVDVVSGVEISPGRKGPDRLAAFLAAAHGSYWMAARGRVTKS